MDVSRKDDFACKPLRPITVRIPVPSLHPLEVWPQGPLSKEAEDYINSRYGALPS